MWLFTTLGFYSVVEKPGTTFLTVRARVRADLDRLRQMHMPALSETIKHAGNDYPFRAIINHEDFARGLARMGQRIHYSNFKEEVGERMGDYRARVYSEVREILKALEQLPPSKLIGAPSLYDNSPQRALVSPPIGAAFGGVVVDAANRLLLREPSDHADGHAWTFPKGPTIRGESPPESAIRHVCEKTGVIAQIESRLPGLFRGIHSETTYYLMSVVDDTRPPGKDTASVRWAHPEEARELISKTQNAVACARDLDVLEAALDRLARLGLHSTD